MPINCMDLPRTEKRERASILQEAPAYFKEKPASAKKVPHGGWHVSVVQKHTVSMCHAALAARGRYIC
ncbi:hypothetical protein [Paraburkholderia sp. J76]|uniref:hypothetical protein n=1 Tax=Paraburkholderia sp. J76 TaxID=2805439 RepID=UPI002ABDDA02|nr:hypothetical protein [Paraburkholderia sp. J76]